MSGSFWSSGSRPPSSASGSSNFDLISNEDATTRTFQRTTSAQVTLDEANAILAEFGQQQQQEGQDGKKPVGFTLGGDENDNSEERTSDTSNSAMDTEDAVVLDLVELP